MWRLTEIHKYDGYFLYPQYIPEDKIILKIEDLKESVIPGFLSGRFYFKNPVNFTAGSYFFIAVKFEKIRDEEHLFHFDD